MNPLLRKERRTALGALKGVIGHSGAASGLAAFVRASLALYQEIIPASGKLPHRLGTAHGAFYLPSEPRYWLRNRADGPRYAGVPLSALTAPLPMSFSRGDETAAAAVPKKGSCRWGGRENGSLSSPGADRAAIAAGLDVLRTAAAGDATADLGSLARSGCRSGGCKSSAGAGTGGPQPGGVARPAAARQRDLMAEGEPPLPPPALRDRLFFTPAPLERRQRSASSSPDQATIFPAWGWLFPAAGRNCSAVRTVKTSTCAASFSRNSSGTALPRKPWIHDHRAVIFGQVATGCAVSDIVRSFGVSPAAYIGYSLGESAGLFASGAWHERDSMLLQMYDSTLFTDDLAGECRAAAGPGASRKGKGWTGRSALSAHRHGRSDGRSG